MTTGKEESTRGGEYEVLLERRAERDLNRLSRNDFLRIDEAIQGLAKTPRPSGTVKLADDLYRIRVGPWRVIYLVDDDSRRIAISRVKRREKDTYRRI